MANMLCLSPTIPVGVVIPASVQEPDLSYDFSPSRGEKRSRTAALLCKMRGILARHVFMRRRKEA